MATISYQCPAGYFSASPNYLVRTRQLSCPNGYTKRTLVPSDQYVFCWSRQVQALTITLTGGSTTEPWHKKHDPEHLKANLPYKAIVKDQNDQPKANIGVTITTEVTSDSGGHVHTNNRPKGKLIVDTGVSTKAGKETITGTTNGSGIFEFTFGAEEASGTHTLTAKCDSGCQAPATATVDVGITSLIRMGYDKTCTSFYCLRGGLEGKHVDNHFYDWRAWIKVVLIAQDFKEEYGEVFKINDSSLIKGGLYDINGFWSPSHKGHRKGIVVDINSFTERDFDFEALVADHNATAKWEEDPPHYHIRLLNNRDE